MSPFCVLDIESYALWFVNWQPVVGPWIIFLLTKAFPIFISNAAKPLYTSCFCTYLLKKNKFVYVKPRFSHPHQWWIKSRYIVSVVSWDEYIAILSRISMVNFPPYCECFFSYSYKSPTVLLHTISSPLIRFLWPPRFKINWNICQWKFRSYFLLVFTDRICKNWKTTRNSGNTGDSNYLYI